MNPVNVRSSCRFVGPSAVLALISFGMFGIASSGFGQTDRVSQLTRELKDTSWVVRLDAAFASGQLKDPRTVEPLIAALGDTDADVRRSAATALGQLKDPRALEALVAVLRDTDAQVRNSTVTALGQIGDPRAVVPLIPTLKDSDADVRRSAANWLGAIKDPRSVEPLIAALKDVEAGVQIKAARALDEIKDPRADEPLIEALKGSKRPVVGGAYRFFIGLGEKGSEGALIAALAQFGTKDMALDFLNCGNPKLADAGRAWAKRNGYVIVADPNGVSNSPVLWGSERLMAMSGPA